MKRSELIVEDEDEEDIRELLSYVITERAVDVHIVSLRRKLRAAGRYIETVRGVGYRFKE